MPQTSANDGPDSLISVANEAPITQTGSRSDSDAVPEPLVSGTELGETVSASADAGCKDKDAVEMSTPFEDRPAPGLDRGETAEPQSDQPTVATDSGTAKAASVELDVIYDEAAAGGPSWTDVTNGKGTIPDAHWVSEAPGPAAV